MTNQTNQNVIKGQGLCRIVRFGIGTQKIKYSDLAQAAQDAGFRAGSANITGMTQTTPAILTIDTGHGLVDGDKVTIEGLSDKLGKKLNGQTAMVTNVTPDTAELLNIDGSELPAYTSGGWISWDESENYVPKRSTLNTNAKAAFLRATTIPKKGIVLTPSDDFQKETLAKYKVTPIIRLFSKDVSRKGTATLDAVTKRQIIAEVTIPFVEGTNEGDSDIAQAARNQFQTQPVWYVEFKPGDEDLGTRPQFVDYPIQDIDDKLGIMEQVSNAVQEMMEEAKSWVDCADDAKIREGIRAYLNDNHAVNEGIGGKGGLYTLPIGDESYNAMKKLRNYIAGLGQYSIDPPENGTAPYMVSNVVYLEDDDFDADNIEMAARDVMTSYSQKFAALNEDLYAVIQGESSGKVAQKAISRVLEELLKSQAGIAAYRQSLGDRMGQLEIQCEMLMGAIEQAQKVANLG